MRNDRERWWRLALACTVWGFALSGCAAHKPVRTLALPPFTPVELAQVPVDDDPPMVEGDDDADDLPPVPVAEGATTPRRQKKKPVKTPAPVTVADAEPPAPVAAPAGPPTPAESASVIGELRPGGGDLDPQAQKEAEDLIATNEKRLGGLSSDVLKAQPALVSNVRNFQKQAMQALQTGDAGGAKTLATKGKLLLDELEKAPGS